jgi:hypothetical protein
VAAEHAGALAELRVGHSAAIFHYGALRPAGLEQLLRAAPQLRVFEADASCEGVEEARRLLRNEAPFGLLRLRNLSVAGLNDTDAVRSFIEHAAAHESLTGIKPVGAPLNLPAALDAVVDAALQLRLTHLHLFECHLSPASVPALVRLLDGSVLRSLDVEGEPSPFFGRAWCAAAWQRTARQHHAHLCHLQVHPVFQRAR